MRIKSTIEMKFKNNRIIKVPYDIINSKVSTKHYVQTAQQKRRGAILLIVSRRQRDRDGRYEYDDSSLTDDELLDTHTRFRLCLRRRKPLPRAHSIYNIT